MDRMKDWRCCCCCCCARGRVWLGETLRGRRALRSSRARCVLPRTPKVDAKCYRNDVPHCCSCYCYRCCWYCWCVVVITRTRDDCADLMAVLNVGVLLVLIVAGCAADFTFLDQEVQSQCIQRCPLQVRTPFSFYSHIRLPKLNRTQQKHALPKLYFSLQSKQNGCVFQNTTCFFSSGRI